MKTYEELVEGLRNIYENADARSIVSHIAIQINITGEVNGICYMEVANRQIAVEPYDYYDRDGLVTIGHQTLEDIIDGKYTAYDAIKDNKIDIKGDPNKLGELGKMVFRHERNNPDIDKNDRFHRFRTTLKIHTSKRGKETK